MTTPSLPVHSKIGASSMHRWSRCPGSVRLSAGIKSTTSSYAEEGTRAHDIAAFYLEHLSWPNRNISEDMKEAITVYTDTVLADFNYSEHNDILVEHRFDLSSLYPGLYGTADCVIYDKSQKLLRVYDYKHGQGHAVEVEANLQLMYYGLGAMLSLDYKGVDEVELVIVQPRCFHPDGPVRRWKFKAVDLLDFAADLVYYAKLTEDPFAPLFAGDHCKFCPAAPTCPELHQIAISQAKLDFKAVTSYDQEKLGNALNWLPVLEGWIKSVREFAYAEAQHGRTPPGWKLVAKRAARKWNADEEEIAEALECLLPDQESFWDKKLKSPTQIEKLLGKQKKEIADLIATISTGTTLAPAEDKRPAILLDPKSEFTKIPVTTED